MPPTETSVDRAYRRYDVLSRILEKIERDALADPTHNRNVELGLVKTGQKKQDAKNEIVEILEELTNLINHLGILDMAAAVELQFQKRVATAIGEARRVVGEHYGVEPLRADRDKLVRKADDFEGLAAVADVIKGRLSAANNAALDQIRDDRNKFAHGTDILVPPATPTEQAREILNEVLTWL